MRTRPRKLREAALTSQQGVRKKPLLKAGRAEPTTAEAGMQAKSKAEAQSVGVSKARIASEDPAANDASLETTSAASLAEGQTVQHGGSWRTQEQGGRRAIQEAEEPLTRNHRDE